MRCSVVGVIVTLTLGLLAAPLAGQAQQPPGKTARIGYVALRSGPSFLEDAFRQGLRELGYVEGHNITTDRVHGRQRAGDWARGAP